MRHNLFISTFLSLWILILASCNDGNDGSTGTINVRISDAPFPIDLVEEANVTISKVELRNKGGSDGGPFLTLTEEEQSFNLLELSNGVTESLVQLEVPVGSYDLIRLFVSEASIKLKDETMFDLQTPSGASTGIKIFLNPGIEVAGGLTEELLLDFDVSKSFVSKGPPVSINGFNFKPVIRAQNMSEAGRIIGTVTDDQSVVIEDAELTLMAADTIFTTTFTDMDGKYAIIGLPAGSYDLEAEKEGFQSKEFENIEVIAANQTVQDFELTP